MRIKTALFFLIAFLDWYTPLSAQVRSDDFRNSKLVWFGVDFTVAKFSFVTDDPVKIVNQYLKSINTVIVTEPDKYDIKKFFSKTEVIYNIGLVIEENLKINPSTLVIYTDYKLDPKKLDDVIKKYDVKEKSGTGLVFIAENLNKVTQTGSYYVCFFDIESKEITDSRRIVGTAKGFGFRNYWAGSIFEVMNTWSFYKN